MYYTLIKLLLVSFAYGLHLYSILVAIILSNRYICLSVHGFIYIATVLNSYLILSLSPQCMHQNTRRNKGGVWKILSHKYRW